LLQHLLRARRGDAAKILGRHALFDDVADFRVFLQLLGFFQRDLRALFDFRINGFDHERTRNDLDFVFVFVVKDFGVLLAIEILLVGIQQAFGKNVEDFVAIDAFFEFDLFQGFEKFFADHSGRSLKFNRQANQYHVDVIDFNRLVFDG